MDKLRLRFEKTGRAVWISHLDLMHTMQRAFSRAGYELKYSEGFNPHPQISIALPLSVGVESYCEIMDFRLKGDADIKSLPERLTAVMPEGIRVTDCYEPETKFAALKYLQIEGCFEYDRRPAGKLSCGFSRKAQFEREGESEKSAGHRRKKRTDRRSRGALRCEKYLRRSAVSE